ncbi:DJ-1/PfpI family protein [Leptospira sp. 96542]|nr:DJ-1/PfpI family protein [Leptospira sp. 96542]
MNYLRIEILFLISFSSLAFSCAPLGEFFKTDKWVGGKGESPNITLDPNKKNVVLLAEENGTEITDLLIPFYLFSETKQFNVIIASKTNEPISVWKGLYLIPHIKIEDINFKPNVIVIPATFFPEDKTLIGFIQKNVSAEILSVCEGARLVANSNSFDGFQITTHASALQELRSNYKQMNWLDNKRYLVDRNLTSTAGVSSAVEGSLFVIQKILGEQTKNQLLKKIHYPKDNINESHISRAIGFMDQLSIAKKVIFGKNQTIGVELNPDADEFILAAYLDSFNRTFPLRIETFGTGVIRSKNGLILYPTAKKKDYDLILCESDCAGFVGTFQERRTIINSKYAFDAALDWIKQDHGESFADITKKLLDY